MAIPPEHEQERLSYFYVNLVAARAGATVSNSDLDYGVDATINHVQQLPNGKLRATGFLFHCQLKATTTSSIENGHVVYDMEVDAYNKLAAWEGNAPCLLILCRLPKSYKDWLLCSEDELLLKHCCYWYIIEQPQSNNTSSQRIKIPRSQLFTPDAVTELLAKVRRAEI